MIRTMSARLSISTDEGLILDLRLGSQPVRIGRAKDNTVKSEDKRTSRHHAIIKRRVDGSYEVQDAGSSYGTQLNGRLVTLEPLKHQDQLRFGGLAVQFLNDAQPDDEVDQTMMTTTLASIAEQRAQIGRMIEEQAALRSEVGIAQQAEDRAKQQRDEAQDEVERLHQLLENSRSTNASLQLRLEDMGRELRERLSVRNDGAELEALRKQLFDEKKLTEKQKLRIAELEERDSTRVAGEQQLKKEIDRLTEQLKKRDQRESELTQAVKPALMRIAELTRELEHTRLQLATTEADLTDLKRGGRR
jgi:pSer/pThr/pTyr-binding forkhead associated (FHA) protein